MFGVGLVFSSAPALAAWHIPGLSIAALEAAERGYGCAESRGEASPRVTVIDYSLPSTERRLWVYDVPTDTVLFHELVTHGRTSGENLATQFSNRPGSLATSLGWYRTDVTYMGKHGRSLRLDGLDPGWNDNARSRAIVVHAAEYATEAFAAQVGRLGRSQGCPALDPLVADAVIDAIAGGTLLLAWYPDDAWARASLLEQCSP